MTTKEGLTYASIGLILGLGCGYFYGSTMSSMDHSMAPTASIDTCTPLEHQSDHPLYEVDERLRVPQITLEATPDEIDGYNLSILVSNFTWAPFAVNQEPEPGKGHAHVLVNGHKIARLYGNWFHLPGSVLCEGKNEVTVTLNANDHGEWVHQGKHIEARVTVTK